MSSILKVKDIDYKNYEIVVIAEDISEVELIIRSKKYSVGFSIKRKCNKEITNYKEKTYSIFNSKETKKVFNAYNIDETINELIDEAKIIVDYLDLVKENIVAEIINKFCFSKYMEVYKQ